jgi:hypothetical protein
MRLALFTASPLQYIQASHPSDRKTQDYATEYRYCVVQG